MSTELIINASLPETRISLVEDGEIQELLIERASGKGIVGNIYKGRVTRVLPGMQAAFVDIGLEKAAFLYVDDVFVHSEIWEQEEGESETSISQEAQASTTELSESSAASANSETPEGASSEPNSENAVANPSENAEEEQNETQPETHLVLADSSEQPEPTHENIEDEGHEIDEFDHHDEPGEEDDDDDDDSDPIAMGRDPGDGDDADDSIGNRIAPPGTVAPSQPESVANDEGLGNRVADSSEESVPTQEAPSEVLAGSAEPEQVAGETTSEQAAGGRGGRGRNHRRGRRGGRNRRRDNEAPRSQQMNTEEPSVEPQQVDLTAAERPQVPEDAQALSERPAEPEATTPPPVVVPVSVSGAAGARRPEFREQRARDRRIRPKQVRNVRGQVNIQDLLKEGQEVLVQVAKDPIATKGARLTCHISLPGRHLVCMPTIDHVGVSRRIERDDERRRLREYVERNRPRNLGFIVRTASGKAQSEKRIKQDIDYLTRLWTEIREKAASAAAPALVYEDLNSVLRAIRDWVTEEIDKIIVDSRYHFNDIQRFVSHFMPSLRQKVELYHGDIPIFDAYNISTELSRALERKVWLKSGGYIVVDQSEALVAIDVNTGRYVGKKNLEDTILKTNLEAVQEIAYQLRLRNCGGIIILDLIDMEKEENRHRVYRALEEALKKDRARPSILKISELGLVEMTRKRTRDTIIRTLCESCSHCEGKGFVKSKQTVAYEVMREVEREGIERDVSKILVQAHPDVIDILAIDERETLDQLERRYRKTIYLQAVSDFHAEQFEVVSEKRDSRGVEAEGRSSQQRERGGERDRDRNRWRERGGRGGERGAQPRVAPVVTPLPRPIVQPLAQPIQPAEQPVEGAPDQILPQMGQEEAAHENVGDQYEASGDESRPSIGNEDEGREDTGRDDDFDNEEDRLAFLRAQAAQDAALAGLSAGQHPTRPGGGHGGRGGHGFQGKDRQGGGRGGWGGRGAGGPGGGGRRRRRGGRGGRFQRGGDRGGATGPVTGSVNPVGSGGNSGGDSTPPSTET